MEAWVGERWHRLVTRAAESAHPHAAVRLEDVTRNVQLMFRAGGGDRLMRIAAATAQPVGGPRGWLQRLAGQGDRACVTSIDEQTLALPPVLAVFDSPALNRDLYLWLAALSACHASAAGAGWIEGNLAATQAALGRFPGLRARYARLVQAHLAQRPVAAGLRGAAAGAELAIQTALQESVTSALSPSPRWGEAKGEGLAAPVSASAAPSPAFPQRGKEPNKQLAQPTDAAPVWLWLHAAHNATAPIAPISDPDPEAAPPRPADARTQQDTKRRRAEQTEDTSNKNGMVMFFRAESILSWGEFVRVNRTGDDDDNQDASKVADDMDHLAIAPKGETLAARVRFDLDLPSASADDLPVGEGHALPEWDFKRGRLMADHCRVQRLRARDLSTIAPENAAGNVQSSSAAGLKRSARQVRRRLEVLRAAPSWQHALPQGDELDLDAWVRHQVDRRDARHAFTESPAIFSRRVRADRSLASLMLADLSLSTDAYATQQARVIDLVRDSLYVFGEALDTVGDPFEMLGFSSVRRSIRVHELKRFGETWSDAARARVAAIKPGFYTRMGAAIRYGTIQLADRPERQRLLLILSDGKPNDLDHYEGRHGLEDTRHAVQAARAAGLVPFCVTIDQQANTYLPRLFGAQGFTLVHRPDQLARALTQVYVRLTASVR